MIWEKKISPGSFKNNKSKEQVDQKRWYYSNVSDCFYQFDGTECPVEAQPRWTQEQPQIQCIQKTLT